MKSEIKKLKSKLAEGDLVSAKRHVAAKNLLEKVKCLTQKNEELKSELLCKEDLVESSQKNKLQNTIRIKELEAQNSKISEKLEIVEIERKKSLDDLAWAQNYYSGFDKKIKDLEAQLSEHKSESTKKQFIKTGNIVKLKIRKDI